MANANLVSAPAPRRKRRTIRRLRIWVAALVAALLVLSTGFLLMGAVTGTHTLSSVAYAQVPPNRGDHSPVWQRCGFYGEPVGDEHAVHSLEHGAVWITYQPSLPQDQIDILRSLTHSQKDILTSPYPGLPAPVVVSAWGRQLPLDTVDQVRLDQALRDIRNGPPAPEPGGGCDGPNLLLSGGTGNPE